MHKSPKTQLTSIDIAKLVETDLADEINDCEAVHSFLSKIYSSRANSTMVLRLWKGFIQEEERAAEVYSRNTQDGLICSALHDSFEDDESEMAPTDE